MFLPSYKIPVYHAFNVHKNQPFAKMAIYYLPAESKKNSSLRGHGKESL